MSQDTTAWDHASLSRTLVQACCEFGAVRQLHDISVAPVSKYVRIGVYEYTSRGKHGGAVVAQVF